MIEGILEKLPSGRRAVWQPDREPVESTSGELFRVYVDGEMKLTRMEFRYLDFRDLDDGGSLKGKWYRRLHILAGEYYSVDGYELRNGQRAAIGEGGKGAMTDDRDWDRVRGICPTDRPDAGDAPPGRSLPKRQAWLSRRPSGALEHRQAARRGRGVGFRVT
jgi:hypothetical protein